MSLTSDPRDPRLTHGADKEPVPQAEVYLVLPPAGDDEKLCRPVRESYRHVVCGAITTMSRPIAETYARDPHFYGSSYCTTCRMHRPVGHEGEFVWIELDGSEGDKVGT